jgi:hypothetical protein
MRELSSSQVLEVGHMVDIVAEEDIIKKEEIICLMIQMLDNSILEVVEEWELDLEEEVECIEEVSTMKIDLIERIEKKDLINLKGTRDMKDMTDMTDKVSKMKTGNTTNNTTIMLLIDLIRREEMTEKVVEIDITLIKEMKIDQWEVVGEALSQEEQEECCHQEWDMVVTEKVVRKGRTDLSIEMKDLMTGLMIDREIERVMIGNLIEIKDHLLILTEVWIEEWGEEETSQWDQGEKVVSEVEGKVHLDLEVMVLSDQGEMALLDQEEWDLLWEMRIEMKNIINQLEVVTMTDHPRDIMNDGTWFNKLELKNTVK